MHVLRRHRWHLAATVGVLALAGCSHEHGPLSDTPDTTSLGNAGELRPRYVSTAFDVRRIPRRPDVVVKGTTQGTTSPLTTEAHPANSLLGKVVDQDVGQDTTPEAGNALATWISGPNLPVEPWNMALESPAGEGAPEGPR